MPTGPKGQKRPADVIGNAVKVMRIATGEETEEVKASKVSVASKGGNARALKLSASERKKIATRAAKARWGVPSEPSEEEAS